MELHIHPAQHGLELRVFSPRAFSLRYSAFCLWGERFRRHNSSSKKQ